MDLDIFPNQRAQADYLKDFTSYWCAYEGGWGSGKTYIAARKTIILTLLNNFPSMAVAPTWSDAGRYLIPELTEACEQWKLPYKIKTSGRPPIFEVNGIPIYLFTGDKCERITGVEVGVAWIDEGARIRWYRDNPTQDIVVQVPGRLRSTKPGIIHQINVSTTPEGMDTWVYELFSNKESDLYKANKDRSSLYVGHTKKNKALQEEYIAGLEATLTPELAQQYLEGKAVNYVANRAHPHFNKDNIVENEKLSTERVYDLGADFNISPACWVLGYQDGNTFKVVDEVVVEDHATVSDMMYKANQKGWGKVKTVWHLDKSARNRNMTGDPQRDEMEKVARDFKWRFHNSHLGNNPPVNARINLLDALICNSKNERRLLVTKNCKKLIDDFNNTGRGSNGYDPGPQKKRGHILDALGYIVFETMYKKSSNFQTINIGMGY